MKKKKVTMLAIEYSKKVCDPQPESIDRIDVRRLVMDAYRIGYNKAHSEHVKCMSDIVNMNLSDIDFPVFTHTKEFREYFDYVMSEVKKLIN